MADERRWSALAAASSFLVALAGCASAVDYVPKAPVVVWAPALDLEVEGLDEGPGLGIMVPEGLEHSHGLTVHVRWRASGDGAGIAQARLAAPQAAPCTAGIEAEVMGVDGQTRWERPLDLGRVHVVDLSFAGDDQLDAGPLVVDLELARAGGTTCVRLPLTGGGQQYATASNLALGVSGGIGVSLRTHSSSEVRLGFEIGRWVGPARLTLGLGLDFGVVHIVTSESPESDSGSSNLAFGMLRLVPAVTFFPLVGRSYALGVSGGLELAAGGSGAGTMADPDKDEAYWGPRLGIIIGAIRPVPFGAPRHRVGGVGRRDLPAPRVVVAARSRPRCRLRAGPRGEVMVSIRASHVLAALAASACARGPQFRPVSPMTATSDGVTVEVDGLTGRLSDPGLEVLVRVSAPDGTTVRGGIVARASKPPCEDELVRAGVIAMDESVVWQRPVPVAGQHHLSMRFPQAIGLPNRIKGASALDLEFERGSAATCLRIPVQDENERATWTPTGRWMVGPRIDLYPLAAGLHVGRLVGPVILGVEETVSAKVDTAAVMASALIDKFVLEASYAGRWAWTEGVAGGSFRNGPRLRLAYGEPLATRFDSSRLVYGGFGVEVVHWWATNGQPADTAFSVGVGGWFNVSAY